jgi:hypothetical protein
VYRDEFDVFLRNETSQTAEKAQKKWRSRAKKAEHDDEGSSPSAASQTSSGRESGSPSDNIHLLIPQAMSLGPSLADLAHQRFLFDFVVPADPSKTMDGFQTFIPGFFNVAAPASCFAAAISAVSLANYGGRCKSVEAKELAVEKYGKALALLGQSLTKSTEGCSPETLAAICLLGSYEVCSDNPRFKGYLLDFGC